MHVNLEMVGDNFSKVHYNNLQGPPDPGRGWPLPLFGPLLWGFFLGPDQMAKLSKAFFMRKICRQEWSSIFLSLCEELASEKRKHIAQNIRPQRPNLTNPPTRIAARDVYRNFIDSTLEAGHCLEIITRNADQYALIEKGQLFHPLVWALFHTWQSYDLHFLSR